MTIEEALEFYALQLEADGRSVHTREQYERHIRLLARAMPGKEIGEVTHVDVARFLVSPAVTQRADGTTKKATSMNALRSTLRTFFNFLHAAAMLPSNPARLVRRAQCGTPPPRALSEIEQRGLLDALARAQGWEAARDHALFHLMLATGIRLASALALDASDLDLDRGELTLRCVKGDRTEVAYLGRAITVHLRAYIKEGQTGPLFSSRQGGRLSARQAQRRLAAWLAFAGVVRRTSPHSLRHSFAMRLYGRTGDIALVQRALGHRSIVSTIVYARWDQARLRIVLG